MTLLENIKQQIDNHKIISFDIFDTLLLRPYVKPTDLFLHLEKLENVKGFATKRIEAEKEARKKHPELEDITIDEIYAEISDKYKHFKEKEMDLERKVLTANPEMKEVYDYALSQNKKIIIISDMYLTEDFLASVLKEKGYKDFSLYVSGNRRKKKGTGSIYRYVLEELNTQTSAFFHIGDNLLSDVQSPEKLGISAYHYEQVIQRYLAHNEKAQILLKKYPNNLDASIMIMAFAKHWIENKTEDFWARIGYEYGGPMCYAYMRWVEQEVLKKGIKQILFVARDGYSLQKVFDSFGHKDIKTHYVYAPRQVFVNCFIDKAIKDRRVLSVLHTYSSKAPWINEQTKNIKTNIEAEKFISEYKDLFNKMEKNERREYEKYIKALDLNESKTCIVDTISSNFSSVQLLSGFLKNKMYCYFYNLHEGAKKTEEKYNCFCFKKSYFPNDILCWDFYEYMMTSPESPILKISDKGAQYKEEISLAEQKRQQDYISIYPAICNFSNDIKEKKDALSCELITDWVNLLFTDGTTEEQDILFNTKISTDASHTHYRNMYTKSSENKNIIEKKVYAFLNLPVIQYQKEEYLNFNNSEKQYKIKIKILGQTVIKKITSSWFSKYYILGIKVLNFKMSSQTHSLHVLGLPLVKKITSGHIVKNKKYKDSDLLYTINRLIEKKLSTFSIHQKTFPQFKSINQGKDVVIIATGPTLKDYQPIKDAINIGVNRAISFNKVHYNYYFVQDFSGATPSYIDEISSYQNCIKFFGLTSEDTSPDKTIPEKYLLANDTYRYRTDWEAIKCFQTKFTYDLSSTALGCGGTVVLPALQFALWTHPKRIYLVGCDTTTNGYWQNSLGNNQLPPEILKERYKEIKKFAKQYYPDVEIISINPVGLKGIFKDIYQETDNE